MCVRVYFVSSVIHCVFRSNQDVGRKQSSDGGESQAQRGGPGQAGRDVAQGGVAASLGNGVDGGVGAGAGDGRLFSFVALGHL